MKTTTGTILSILTHHKRIKTAQNEGQCSHYFLRQNNDETPFLLFHNIKLADHSKWHKILRTSKGLKSQKSIPANGGDRSRGP